MVEHGTITVRKSPACATSVAGGAIGAAERTFMARETVYIAQGFIEKGSKLIAEPAMRCKSEEAARRAAARMGETKAGAVAFSSSGDAELGDFDDEPKILSIVGHVPESFQQ